VAVAVATNANPQTSKTISMSVAVTTNANPETG
jgi:hypothetical protein